jgi:hypothetical protein
VPVRTTPNPLAEPRLFIDADVLFAGSVAPSEYGASLIVLRLAEISLIKAITSQQVIQEAERNLAAKLPGALSSFRLIIDRCLEIVPNPSQQELGSYHGLAHPKDLPILVAALKTGCPWLVTFNTRHYQPGHPDIEVLSPGKLMMRVRDLLARLG